MKYVQPYGVPDPEAAYINGNPSTGTMGSIPPAASIEHPQREVVNFIKDSAVTPDPADLRQLSKSVQSGKVTYSLDGGTSNFIAITPTPPIAAYQIGMRFCIKAANANTGPTQLNVSNVGWAPVVHGDLSPLGAWEIGVGQLIEVGWDGTHWQMLTGSGGGIIMMTAPRDIYVNSTTGSDTLYDGSQATVDAPNAHGPFKTLQHAANQMATYNLGGWDFRIHLANGTYNAPDHMLPVPNGSGYVWIIGNPLDPTQVVILPSLVNNGDNNSSLGFFGGAWMIDGLYMKTWFLVDGAVVEIWNMAFGKVQPGTFHLHCVLGATLVMAGGGTLRVIGDGTPTGAGFIYGGSNSMPHVGPPGSLVRITGAVTYSSGFAVSEGGAFCAPSFTSISIDAGGSVTGQRYYVGTNGIIATNGQGINYFPGTIAGVQNTGGQYV
jgi:hypothetical protein